MFKKFGARVYRWLHNSFHEVENSPEPIQDSGQVHLRSNELCHLSIYTAIGGKILEFRHNDPKKDEYDYNLYLIPDNEDFTQSAGKIIMMEILKSR